MIHRCEAGPEVGAGHFFRQLALAEGEKARGDDPLILVTGRTPELVRQAEAVGVEMVAVGTEPGTMEDASTVIERGDDRNDTSVVIDGYRFNSEYYRRLGEGFGVVAAVDDLGAHEFPVDVLVNPNPHASELNYIGPECRLLGPRYALLRRQFVRTRGKMEEEGRPRVPDHVSRVLVAYGGANIGEMTGRALEALDAAGYRNRVDVVLGPAAPNAETVKARASNATAEVRVHVNVRRMSRLVRGQHLAFCAAGGMSWELACLGVPMIQTAVADNQEPIAAFLNDEGIVLQTERVHDLRREDLAALFRLAAGNRTLRARMSKRGIKLVDGRGVERVLDHIGGITRTGPVDDGNDAGSE